MKNTVVFIVFSIISMPVLRCMESMDVSAGIKRKYEATGSNSNGTKVPWYIRAAHLINNLKNKNSHTTAELSESEDVRRIKKFKKITPTLNTIKGKPVWEKIKKGSLDSSILTTAFAPTSIKLRFIDGLTHDNIELMYSLLDHYPLHLRQNIMEHHFPLDVMVEKEFVSIIKQVCTQFGLRVRAWDFPKISLESNALAIIPYLADIENDSLDLLPLAIENNWSALAMGLAEYVKVKEENEGFVAQCLDELVTHRMIDVIKRLQERGVNINISSKMVGLAPLDLLETIVEMGADIDAIDDMGNTVLLDACKTNQTERVRKLLSLNAHVRFSNDTADQPIHYASSPEIIDLLKAAGADLQAQNYQGMTPLMNLCVGNKVESIKKLIEYGVAIDTQDSEGTQALHYANSPEVVDLLLAAGAHIEAIDAHGETPLLFNCCDGNFDVVQRLIDRGANVNAVSNDGFKPVHIAAAKNRLDVLKHLVEKAKVGVNIPSDKLPSYLPIHCAAGGLAVDCLSYLIERTDAHIMDDAKVNILVHAIDKFINNDQATEKDARSTIFIILDHFKNKADNDACLICREPSDRFVSPYCMHLICHECKPKIINTNKCHICKAQIQSPLLMHPKMEKIRNEFF